MKKVQDFTAVLDTLPVAACVISLVYGQNGEVEDFCIEYTNNTFLSLSDSTIKVGTLYTSVSDKLSPEISWPAIMATAAKSDSPVSREFYSALCGRWLRAVLNRLTDEILTLVLIDVSQGKEDELKIKRQNVRLASLTDELYENHSSLRSELSSIQTLNEQLRFAAYHDTLTNLYNRAWFNRCLSECIANKKPFGLLLLGLDNIRKINDASGHASGDDVIRRTAVLLRKFEDKNTTAFRFGGDEFILLKRDVASRDEFANLGSAVLKEFNTAGRGVSGGMVLFPEDSDKGDDLLKFADMAKGEVKRNGKNNIIFFKQAMQNKFLQRLNIEAKLSKALKNNSFELYFQPQFSVQEGSLRGFEALIRWHDADLGWISPETFIPLAEESRLIIPLGNWVLDTALSVLADWEKKFNFDGIMSINVSPVQFQKSDFLDTLKAKVKSFGVSVKHLEIEITEGVLIDNMQETVAKLDAVHSLGIGISLDDFGTGYSSLRYLQILPLTTLKIDKSFISNINIADSLEANITESIVNLVSRMGLDTIAEGVETDSQLDVLKRMKCQTIQGFLKGKPMPQNLCERMLSGDSSVVLTIASEGAK